ncbi:hypothetical protein [Carboxylicivirga sp. RSCT41]|uniref:hypothetical protein n=1 Tax=Carboxylicivirga agarovorans TaxID=3417570 RepID=UPI003D33EB5A
MKKKILYITSANLATNPRLVKEIDFLSLDYNIDVVLYRFIHWSSKVDKQMVSERKHINFKFIDISKKHKVNWVYWGIVEKFCRTMLPLFKNNLSICAGALSRKSLKTWNYLNGTSFKSNYEFVVAHNLPALYPAFKIAKKWNIPFAFDIEDYDPGMSFKDRGKHYEYVCKTLYKKLLPKATYLTSASPLIGEYALKLIGGHHKHKVIINAFPKKEFIPTPRVEKDVYYRGPLRFIWFSLTISFNRGLEEFIQAISQCNISIELTLIGDMDNEFRQKIINPTSKKVKHIIFNIHPPISQQELHKELINHHVGLSLENPQGELNRELCLTNKIIAYAQAGNYILASNTKAQKAFIQEYPDQGMLCSLSNGEELIKAIKNLNKQRDMIINNLNKRYHSAINLAIENQMRRVKKLISEAI